MELLAFVYSFVLTHLLLYCFADCSAPHLYYSIDLGNFKKNQSITNIILIHLHFVQWGWLDLSLTSHLSSMWNVMKLVRQSRFVLILIYIKHAL